MPADPATLQERGLLTAEASQCLQILLLYRNEVCLQLRHSNACRSCYYRNEVSLQLRYSNRATCVTTPNGMPQRSASFIVKSLQFRWQNAHGRTHSSQIPSLS
ncbi:unnamed protein product [Sphagnum troendelagicum]|uniref:Uncharacterized protein n=1 Tax=Sphagnum troendelagicum TaxID=128251 RepID=A0ABP0TBY8_9BRYO